MRSLGSGQENLSQISYSSYHPSHNNQPQRSWYPTSHLPPPTCTNGYDDNLTTILYDELGRIAQPLHPTPPNPTCCTPPAAPHPTPPYTNFTWRFAIIMIL